MNRLTPAVLDQLEAWAGLYDAEAAAGQLTTAADFVDFLRHEAPRQHADIAHRGHRWAAVRWQSLNPDEPDDVVEEPI